MQLTAVQICNYKSFGPDPELVALGLTTTIIGKNNVGKSNIIDAIRLCWDSLARWPDQQSTKSIPSHDAFQVEDSGPVAPCSIAVEVLASKREIEQSALSVGLDDNERELVHRLFASHPFWVSLKGSAENPLQLSVRMQWNQIQAIEGIPEAWSDAIHARDMWRARCGPFMKALAKVIAPKLLTIGGRTQDERKAPDLQADLALWQSPPVNARLQRATLNKFERLFAAISGLDGARFCTPKDGSVVLEWSDKYLAISSYGDGTRKAISLAHLIVSSRPDVILLEEPESSMHPDAVRRVIAAMSNEVKAQTIMTTHSPVCIDASKATVIVHVRHNGVRTFTEQVSELDQVYAVLDDLDVRPSDLLQANVVIWVEGPSDRILIRKWLELAGASFTEGVQYHCSYYAGAMRAHYGCSEQDPRLINMLRLGRNICVVADSDADKVGDVLDDHKQRLAQACSERGGCAWTTAGREIENYLPAELVGRTLSRLTGGVVAAFGCDQFADFGLEMKKLKERLPHGCKWIADYDKDKTRFIGELVVDMVPNDLRILDLEARVGELIDFIGKHNCQPWQIVQHRASALRP